MIYIIKQAGLYQNKVNSSLISNCNCKMGYSFTRIQIACSKEARFYLVSKKIPVNSRGVRTPGQKLRFSKLVRGQ